MMTEPLQLEITRSVKQALQEDIGTGDITAQLIPQDARAKAMVISRDNAVMCGQPWVDEVFRQFDPTVELTWHVTDGDLVQPDQQLFSLTGSTRSLLSSERCALNFLQTLSGTATVSHYYASLVAGTNVRLLDTRKTIPGLRLAQKYAVLTGGCHNHRIGLFDAYLIKENHIAGCGSITAAVNTAKQNEPDKPVEIEVECLKGLTEALAAGADIIMLDNFSLADMREAVGINNGQSKLEASGNITEEGLLDVAKTGVDYISIGALTKHVKAVDLSMRLLDK
ncbi:MAG: carboxylating nicotinate-nucleotide diphosphorylase [Pseudomonadales bacterium]|nr:carboxylating nicotinate-nucleotide diphosphorylase [Pseudomonadales bacterium]